MKNIDLIKLKALAAAVADTEQGSSAWDKATDALNAKFSSHHLVELIEQLEAVQRERDEAINSHRHHAARLIDDRGQLRQRAEAAEAELKRRDDVEAVATRGMPKYEIYTKQSLFDDGSFRETDMVELSVLQRQQEITRQLAVESNRLSDEKRELVEELKRRDELEPDYILYQCGCCGHETTDRMTRCPKCNHEPVSQRPLYDAAPAAEPEKVVKLPFKVETSNVPFAAYTWNAAIEECIKALDAAGVKWVEGE